MHGKDTSVRWNVKADVIDPGLTRDLATRQSEVAAPADRIEIKLAAGEHARNADTQAVLSLYHEVAAGASGAFVQSTVEPQRDKGGRKPPLHRRLFRIGDADGMTADALGSAGHSNVYFGTALMRPDLPRDSRGGLADIRAVLGLVIDDDADIGKRAILPSGIQPSFIITTCREPVENRHIHYVFAHPQSQRFR